MLKFVKKIFIVTGLLLLVLLVLAVVLYRFHFAPKVDQYLTATIQRTLEEQFKREVSLERVHLSFPNPQIHISNLAIAREDKLSEGTLLSTKVLKAKVLLRSLISKQLIIDDIVLDTPTVRIEFDEQGRSNLPVFEGKKAEEPPTPSRFDVKKLVERLYFPHIRIIDGEMYFVHKQQQLSVSVKRINTLLSLSLKDLHVQGNIALEDGEIEYQDRGKIATAISGDLEVKNEVLSLSAFQIMAGRSEVTVNGTLANFSKPTLDVSVLAYLALDEVDRYANINQNLSGLVDFKGSVTGPIADITARGHLTCSKGTAWKLAFEDVKTDLQYQGKQIAFSSLEGDILDGHVGGQGQLSFSDPPSYKATLTVDNWNIRNANVFTPSQLDIAGDLSGDINVQGDSFWFGDLILQSSLKFRDAYTYGVDIERMTAQLGIQNRTLTIRELDADLFQGKVKGGGSLALHEDFLYQVDLALQNIALAPIMALIPQPPDVSGQINGSITAQGTHFDLTHLTLDAKLQGTNLKAYAINAKTLNVSAEIKDKKLSVSNVSAQLFKGTLQGQGMLVLAGDAVPKFDTKFTFNDISVQAVLQQFAAQHNEQGLDIEGKIKGNFALAGNSFVLSDLRGDVALTGTGTIKVPSEQKLPKTELPLEIAVNSSLQKKIVTIATLQVNSATLQMTTSGTIDLGGPVFSLDYQVASEDLQTLMKQILVFLPGIEDNSPLRQFAGNIDHLRGMIQGPVSDLEIQADAHFSNADFVWIKADEMTADVSYQKTTLTLKNLQASHKSANIQATGTLELVEASNPQLDIPVTLTSGELADYLAMFKQNLPITGTVKHVQTTIQGSVRNLGAIAALTITDGSVWKQSFDTFSGELELTDNRVSIKTLAVKKNGGNITLNGFVGFDLSFQVDLKAGDLNVHDIEALEDIAVQYEGTIDLTLQAEGTVKNLQGSAKVLFKNLSYNEQPIEDVTCEISMEQQTIQVSLATFRKKFSTFFEVSLTSELPYRAELVMEGAAVEQLLSLVVDIEGIRGIITGKIMSEGSLRNFPKLSAKVNLSELNLDIYGQKLKNDQAIDFVVTQQKLTVNSFELKGEELGLFVKGDMDFQGNYDLDLDGIVDLRAVSPFLPETLGITSLAGRIQLICSVRGTFLTPQIEGIVEINQGNVKVAAYPDPITNISGKLAFTKGKIEIPRITGRLSKGTFVTYGEISYTDFTPDTFNVEIKGKNFVVQSLIDSLTVTISPHIRFSGDLKQPTLAGEIFVHDALYSQEIDLQSLIFDKSRKNITLITPGVETESQPLVLELAVKAPKNIKFKNQRADLDLRFDLLIQGISARPQLTGRVEMLGGRIQFGNIRYTIVGGVFDFLDPLRINPEMNIQVETAVQEYQIQLGIEGTLDQLSFNMNSEPFLSESEITRLLIAGSLQGKDGYGVVTRPLQTLLEGGIERVMNLDQFTIDVDPLLSKTGDSESSPTVTLAKRLFDKLLLTYTTTVGGVKKSELIEVDYDISNNLSINARRDERGEVEASFTYQFKLK